MIHRVPSAFRPTIRVEYPPDNRQIFEEWFFHNVYDIPGERVYLPVFWCSFQVNNDYGKGYRMRELQEFVDGLDRSKKYFTITQYDDGPLVDFKDLDILVFGSGGGRIDVPIPLVCMPHPFHVERIVPRSQRRYLASFVGSMTHDIRRQMIAVIDSLPREDRNNYYILDTSRRGNANLPIDKYCEIMANSAFALCPRGYGKSSFRICEALQYGTTPVYLSDEFIEPFGRNFFEYGYKIYDPANVHKELEYIDDRGYESEGHQEWAYQYMYTFEALKTRILEWLKRTS